MKQITCFCLSFFCLNIAVPAWAQVTEGDPLSSPPSISAADLAITPRLGGSISTSGSGTPRFSRLDALVPVWQNPGASLTFVEAHLLWLDYETLGTNLVLGQRFFDAGGDRLWGGYLAYDTRDTGNNQFHQIGLGLEHLSDAWDARLNGSFPIGETRPEFGTPTTLAESVQLSALQFQGNSLLASGQRTTTQLQRFEAALLNLDGEVGGKLFTVGDFAQVRGYGGLYYFNATNIDAVGWRLRLEARAANQYILGLAVQDDAVFGTNIIANFQVGFGGFSNLNGDRGSAARLGDFVARNSTIAIAEQTETRILTEILPAQIAVNPVTGEPWFFQHVGNTGAEGGDGTFENPFGTIAAGIGAAGSNGTNNRNEIVYVQFGSNPTQTSAIAIPDNIQLLSVAPIQTINTQLGTVQLPLSGTGQRPQINATVTMGNSTTLSGFNITNVAGNGTTTGDGINASNVTGFSIINNTVGNVPRFGIFVGSNNGGTISDLAITDNSISNVTGYDGIFVGASNGSTINNVTIANNTVTNIARTGIGLGAHGNSTLSNVLVDGNTIDRTGTVIPASFGIGIGVDTASAPILPAQDNGSTVSNVRITNNRVSNAGVTAAPLNPAASFGVATQSSTSRVCFQLANNTSINPPSPGAPYTNLLDVYAFNVVDPAAPAVPGNFQVVNLSSVNSSAGVINVFITFPALPNPAFTNGGNSTDVTSCN